MAVRKARSYLLLKEPEELFKVPDALEVRKQYRELALEWHPDRNKDDEAVTVFAHINNLYDRALEKIKKGTWERSGFFEHEAHSGKKISFTFKRKFPFELGDTYISDDHVTYIVAAHNESLVRNYEKNLSRFTYASDKMKNEVARYLPTKVQFNKLSDGRHVVTTSKTPDLFRLRDVLNIYKGEMEYKHVAWIESSLYNLCCYFNYAGIVHNDISLDTYFISPEFHSGSILGGWWYAVQVNSKLSQVPRHTFDLLPSEVKTKKRAIVKIDLELTRAVGRELLGANVDKAPDALRVWLKSVATNEPLEEYKSWQEILKESFGTRRFAKMDITPEEVYS